MPSWSGVRRPVGPMRVDLECYISLTELPIAMSLNIYIPYQCTGVSSHVMFSDVQ